MPPCTESQTIIHACSHSTTEKAIETAAGFVLEGFRMNRWVLIGSIAGILTISTGCLHHNTRGGCSSCESASCSSGTCGDGCASDSCSDDACGCQACGRADGGLLGKTRGRLAGCYTGCGRNGCTAGPLGWQQGGHNYSSHMQLPFQPGPPAAQVAYPYYTHRGPRDFLMANPPSIGP